MVFQRILSKSRFTSSKLAYFIASFGLNLLLSSAALKTNDKSLLDFLQKNKVYNGEFQTNTDAEYPNIEDTLFAQVNAAMLHFICGTIESSKRFAVSNKYFNPSLLEDCKDLIKKSQPDADEVKQHMLKWHNEMVMDWSIQSVSQNEDSNSDNKESQNILERMYPIEKKDSENRDGVPGIDNLPVTVHTFGKKFRINFDKLDPTTPNPVDDFREKNFIVGFTESIFDTHFLTDGMQIDKYIEINKNYNAASSKDYNDADSVQVEEPLKKPLIFLSQIDKNHVSHGLIALTWKIVQLYPKIDPYAIAAHTTYLVASKMVEAKVEKYLHMRCQKAGSVLDGSDQIYYESKSFANDEGKNGVIEKSSKLFFGNLAGTSNLQTLQGYLEDPTESNMYHFKTYLQSIFSVVLYSQKYGYDPNINQNILSTKSLDVDLFSGVNSCVVYAVLYKGITERLFLPTAMVVSSTHAFNLVPPSSWLNINNKQRVVSSSALSCSRIVDIAQWILFGSDITDYCETASKSSRSWVMEHWVNKEWLDFYKEESNKKALRTCLNRFHHGGDATMTGSNEQFRCKSKYRICDESAFEGLTHADKDLTKDFDVLNGIETSNFVKLINDNGPDGNQWKEFNKWYTSTSSCYSIFSDRTASKTMGELLKEANPTLERDFAAYEEVFNETDKLRKKRKMEGNGSEISRKSSKFGWNSILKKM